MAGPGERIFPGTVGTHEAVRDLTTIDSKALLYVIETLPDSDLGSRTDTASSCETADVLLLNAECV